MKNIFRLLCMLALFYVQGVHAQTGRGKLTAAEFFFDTDPGQGSGTSFTLQGNANDAFRTALQTVTPSLSVGTHVLQVRYRDSLNNWGPVFKSIVHIENSLSARNIGALLGRAYWNGNTANAVNLIIVNGNASSAINNFIESTPQPVFSSPGLQKLSVELMGVDGQYGKTFHTMLKVDQLIGVNRLISAALAEVFWDNNPGSATGMIILNGNAGEAINSFATASAINTFSTPGLHKLHVRLLDPNGNGNTSPTFTTIVKIDASLALERAIRVDAGKIWFDNAVPPTPNLLALDGNWSDAIEESLHTLASPPVGLHKINVQFRDSISSQWGPIFTTTISVEGPLSYRNINVAEGQLYWDNDTNLLVQPLLAFDGAFDQAIESALQNNVPTPGAGLHTLCVRFKEVANNWSNVFRISIQIDNPITVRNIQLTQGEVHISDTSFMVIALNGNFAQALDEAQATLLSTGIPTGLHKLKVRLMGENNQWGPFFTSALLITPCSSSPAPIITYNGSTNVCLGGQVVLNAPAGFNTYTWLRGNTIVGSGMSYTASVTGSYVVVVTDNTDCPGASPAVQVNVGVPVVISGNSSLCQGTTDSLTVPLGYAAYSWSGGSNTYKQPITAPGTYTVTVTDNAGCTSSATKSIAMLPAPAQPVISLSGPAAFCPGQNVTLTSNISNNIQWNVGPTTASIITDTSGVYTVTVTGNNGCQNTSAPVITTRYPMPQTSIYANGPTTFCAGGTLILSTDPASAYLWSNNLTSSSIQVTSSGTYSVSTTDSNGCQAQSGSVVVTVNPLPLIPVISASGPLDFCNGSSVTLTSSAATNNLWSNGVTTQSQIVYQSITLTDTVSNVFGCKSGSAPVQVNVHPVASITASGPTTFCADEQVTLSANPSSGVNYLWSTGSTASSISVNTSQLVSVIVTEAGPGCKDTAYMNILVNPLPTGTISAAGSTNVCSGSTLALNTSGSPNSIYQWYLNGSPITYTIYNIFCGCYQTYNVYGYSYAAGSSGTYSAKIIDTLTGCSSMTNSIAVNVILPPQPLITANGGTTLCIGANTQLSSTAAQAYLWNTGDTTQQITASTQGIYQVTITDQYGCTRSSNPTPVSFYQQASIIASGPTTFCAGDSVNLSAYPLGTYVWSNGSTSSSINNITSTGTYSLVVTDTNGCVTQSAPVQVTVNPIPLGSISLSGPSTACLGNSVAFTTTPVANCIYKWYYNGSPITSFSYNNQCNCYYPVYTYGNTFNASYSGSFSAEIIDTLTGCSGMTNAISALIYDLPIPVITQTNFIECYGQQTAALMGTASGTIAPYTYLWNNTINGNVINNLGAGTYALQVTDANGCQNDTTILITQPALVSASVSSPTNTRGYQITCYGDSDGSATVYPSGGTAPYTYLWSTGATTQTISNLPAGTYTVTVFDANNCTPASTTVTLTQPDPLSVNLQPHVFYGGHHISCYGGQNGSILANVSGGTANMDFLWSNGQTTQSATGLSAGTYTVQITDSVGCVTTASSTLTQPSALTKNISTSQFAGYEISCPGQEDGSIMVVVNGGTAPYQISWADTSNQFVRTLLGAGTYYASISDTLGCTMTDSVVLNEPDTIGILTTGSMLNCYGDSNGTVSAIASGDHPPFTYAWANLGAGAAQSNLGAGFYIVTATDSRGCTRVEQAEVEQPTAVQAYAFGTFIGCGTQIGLLSVTGTGGTPPYTQLWSNGSTASFQNNQPLGTYSVTLTDSHGCIDTSTAIILSPPVLQATVSNYSTTCDSITTVPAATVSVSASGGVAPYMYLWSNGSTNDTLSQLETGYYSVIVTDANGCTTQATASAFNNDAATIFGDSLICQGLLANLSTVPGTSYTWSQNNIPFSNTQSISVGQGLYHLDMINLNGCSHSASVQVVEQVCNTIINLSCLLQGYYEGAGMMRPVLMNQGEGNQIAECDSIIVELREAAAPYHLINSSIQILQRDGTVQCVYPPFNDTAYIVIKHRCHIETWSATPQILGTLPLNYDFTDDGSKAFGGNMADLLNGHWGLYTGDMNEDGVIDGLDYNEWEIDNMSFAGGYLRTDLNGDGVVDGLDFLLWEINNNLFIGSVIP
jgi:hypothetical protein